MSEKTVPEESNNDTTENTTNETVAPKPKISKKIILIILLIVIVVIAAGLYFFIFRTKTADVDTEHNKAKTADVFDKAPTGQKNIYLNLEDFVVDLSAQQTGKSHFLKLSLTLNLFQESDATIINDKLPIIRDNFQLYLRELHENDLNRSGGMYSLKEELLIRLNKILYPIQVKDLLFREILIR